MNSLDDLRPGDVIEIPTGKYSGFAIVIDPGTRSDRDDPRPYVLTEDRQARRLSMVDFNRPVTSLTRMKVPRNFNGRNAQSRRELSIQLATRLHGLDRGGKRGRGGRGDPSGPGDGHADDREISRLRAAIRAHPCHGCADRESHARWAERHHRLTKEAGTLRRRIESRTNTIARQFDRVCDVLTSLGYLRDDKVTGTGQTLMRIYTDMDLLAAECLRTGLWDGLAPADLAAALAVLVFESRRADDATPPRLPRGPVKEVIRDMVTLWGQLDRLEKDNRVEFLREPDLGFAWAAQAWASGATLDEVLTVTDLAAGDFVRWMKQLLDLAGQVADAAGGTPLRETARETITALRRGVVSYSSLTE
jgi:ATP-dependent RNA helicase HelY